MRFEERELKEYAEPVLAGTLKPGTTYFAVQFLDEDMLVPVLEPFIYLGKNLRLDDQELYYFQRYESYSIGVRFETVVANDMEHFQVFRHNQMTYLFEFERALDQLMSCSLRRSERQC